ncbi:MAG: GGDEF domain-containing protein, partial [Cellulomonadaceae bacterium]|nr:GGDEF domain-containing protein [Cellulomonadaceae bacterium]
MSRPGVTEWFEPRDRVAAARTLTIAAVVAAVTTVGFEVVAVATGRVGSSRATLVVAIVIGLVLLVAARTYSTRAETLPALAWTAIAVFGVGVVVWVGLGTLDGSAAGQIGLVYPVVYASAHLRRPVALGVWGLAVVADATVAFSVLPFAVAAADVAVITAALFMLTSVLLTVGHHQDRLTDQLAELASADALTGLATRRELERAAGVALGPRVVRRRDRTEPAGVGLLIVDLDHFKQLNDTYGHEIGDAA